ncbi:MAG: Gfo/Idh/MocA family oxidoreductase [Pyrinomonadaceae bacterium]
MNDLRFAVIEPAFGRAFQLAAWNELKGARCVALCNRTRQRAEKLALQFNVPAIYDDPEEMLAREEPDFIDIITDVKSHAQLVRLAASRRVAVICQKPMASSLEESQLMVQTCREAAVPFFHMKLALANPLRQR